MNRSSSVKQYVLDTNVLLHDPTALFQFEENNIFLPLIVLEELDKHKKGVADIARNARQVTRSLGELLQHGSLKEGFSLAAVEGSRATGRLFLGEATASVKKARSLDTTKPDNLILACLADLNTKGTAVLVTKDINLRVKALALSLPAQDYRNDRSFSDEDLLPVGFQVIDDAFWLEYANKEDAFFRKTGRQYVRVPLVLPVNSFLEDRSRNKTQLWRVESHTDCESVLYALKKESAESRSLLSPRNIEQVMALQLLNDAEIDAVSLVGPAGTGKTLLAVAAGLEQVRQGRFEEVLITRATVPMGEEIGFLPGSETDKMGAWLGGTLRDVFSVLQLDKDEGGKGSNPLRSKVEICSMSFMRGRSFQGKYIVIDEAQNLTAGQARALLTRAGEGSKVVLTGNLAQIDTPYLDEGSSGLAWAVKNLQDWPHAGHLILNRGERSRLATYVEGRAAQRE